MAIGEWSQTLVVFLAGCVPECELDRFAVYSTVGHVILEDCWYVALRQVSMAL